MKKNTISDYGKAIKKKYAAIKSSNDANALLIIPTPAGLKKMCLLMLPNLNAIDLEKYKRFFLLKGEADFYKQINNFDTSKFKALCKFLNGNSESTALERLELLAILVGLEQRPYSKFSALLRDSQPAIVNEQEKVINKEEEKKTKSDLNREKNTNNHNEEDKIVTSTQNLTPESENTEITIIPKKLLVIPKSRNIRTNLIKLMLLLFVITITGAYLVKSNLFKEKGCMVWVKDHYEKVDCDTKTMQSFYSIPVVPLNRETCKYLRKITVSDTTTFFNPDGSPRIWYGKSANKELEYFTYFGLHPETGNDLKKITNHMIDKYVKNKQ